MIESLRPDLAAHRGAPDKTPAASAGHAGGRGRARDPVHHRHPGRHRRGRGATGSRRSQAIADSPSPARARAGGDRAELPAQARHRDARRRHRARPRTTSGRSRWPGWSCRPTCTSRRRRTSPTPTSSATCSTPASTTGAGCRRSPPTTSTPNARGRRCAPLRAATEAARPRAGAAADGLPGVRPRPGPLARPGDLASRCWTAPTPRAWAATTRVPPGPERHEAAANVGTGAEVIQIGRRSTAWYSGADARRRRC